ncbi:MAG: helix-turn-helix domain-containing protein [Methylocella sp.]
MLGGLGGWIAILTERSDERRPLRPTPKSVETRSRIVKGALQALERNGIGETTTRKIAFEAKVRLATLHYHFESKEAVLLSVLEELLSELTLTLRKGSQKHERLPDRIAKIVQTARGYAERTRAKQIVQFELTLYALRTKGSEWLATRQYDAYVAAYAALLTTNTDPILPQAQSRELSRFILAGIDGLILQDLAGVHRRHTKLGVTALIAAAQSRAEAFAAPISRPGS